MKYNYVISCEHGGNQIPSFCEKEIKIPLSVLNSHRGFDDGALDIAKYLAKKLKLPSSFYTKTRLVIDYNRTKGKKGFYSEFSLNLSAKNKDRLEKDYDQYRKKFIELLTKNNIHLAIHSFTPILNGVVRNADIGLLYDPKRETEKAYCQFLKLILNQYGFKVRFNYPYKGISDGLTSAMRKIKKDYSGIEIELNQALLNYPEKLKLFKELLAQSILEF